MTLQEFVNNLNDLLETNPEAAQFKVVYSSGGEGNVYDDVYFGPSIGIYEDSDHCYYTYYDETGMEKRCFVLIKTFITE